MKERLTWNLLMETRTDRRKTMKTPALVTIITCLHLVAVGAFFFIQGCGTRQRASVEPPPAPIMPPDEAPRTMGHSSLPAPVFQPPLPVEEAPAAREWTPGDTYVIKKGDSLSVIAKKHGLSTRELAELNGITNPNKIRIGQKLLLPSSSGGTPAPVKRSSRPAAVAVGGAEYVVQKGDSLSRIASRNGTTVKALREANKLKSDTILIGQKLVIPGTASEPAPAPVQVSRAAPAPVRAPAPAPVKMAPPPAAAPQPEPEPESIMIGDEAFEYVVSEGDSLDSIARDFVVLKEDLMTANNLSSPDGIRPGQKLIIPIASP